MLKLYAQQTDGKYTNLDLPDDFSLSLNISIFDIRDITKRGSAYSTTIKLPSTAKNDAFFLDAYDFKSSLFYNQKQHIKAYITADDESTYMVGKLFILSAQKVNDVYSYEVSFVSTVSDVFTAIEGNTIRDILSADTFNYDVATYKNNNYNSPSNVAIAPVDCGDSYFKWFGTALGLREMSLRPVVNLYWLIQKILSAGGYTIAPSSYININDWFKRLYVLGDNYKWITDYVNTSKFIGNELSDILFTLNPNTYTNTLNLINNYTMDLGKELYDPNNIHHDTLYYFNLTPAQYNIKESINIRFTTRISVPISYPISVGGTINNAFKLDVKYKLSQSLPNHTFYITGSVTNITTSTFFKLVDIDCYATLSSADTLNITTATTDYFKIDNLKITTNISGANFVSGYNHTLTLFADLTIEVAKYFQVLFDTTNHSNIPLKYLFTDTLMASDFLKDVFRAFNLFLRYDDLNPSVIHIQDFDNYFTNTIDASNLIDSSNITVVLNHEYQSKNLSMAWADRSDYYCKTHKDITEEGYGDRSIKNISEYSQSDHTIKTRLGTIAMVDEGDGFIRNAVYYIDEQTGTKKLNDKHGLRILSFNGNANYQTWINYQTGSGIVVPTVSMYSHYETIDAPQWTNILDGYKTPIININYSFPTINWFTQSGGFYTTNNDLYRLLFFKYLTNINSKDARVIKVKMLINRTDGIDKLHSLIFYDGGLFFVNKISNFKGHGKVYDVELVKVSNINLYDEMITPQDTGDEGMSPPTAKVFSPSKQSEGVFADVVSANEVIVGGNAVKTYIKQVKYTATMGNIEIPLDGTLAQIATIINTFPNASNTITISINGTTLQTITSTSPFYQVRGVSNYNSATYNNTLGITTVNNTGDIDIFLLINKII